MTAGFSAGPGVVSVSNGSQFRSHRAEEGGFKLEVLIWFALRKLRPTTVSKLPPFGHEWSLEHSCPAAAGSLLAAPVRRAEQVVRGCRENRGSSGNASAGDNCVGGYRFTGQHVRKLCAAISGPGSHRGGRRSTRRSP